jgi:hypothetical protein
MKKITALSIIIASLIPKVSLTCFFLTTLISPIFAQTQTIKKAEIVRAIPKNDDVTLRIKVTGEGDRPVMGLSFNDFKLEVENQPIEIDRKKWKSPEQSEPPPAWIVVLLDMSGSMASPDSSGKSKLEGGIEAINQFIDILAERGGDTHVAIVPFGEGSGGENLTCDGFEVKKETLDKFFSPKDIKLKNYLDYLANLKPCASTNLYQPLDEAVEFLGNVNDPRFYLTEEAEKKGELAPRLSIILLSDGYHNRANEVEEFAQLSEKLKTYDNIIVHTLGYGLTPQQLAKKYNLSKPATRQDLNEGKVPEEEFVDKQRLAEIAQITGGIAEFSGDAEDIAENLRLFLNALLGEYEITYTDPNPERGATHNVIVEVAEVKSEPKSYTVPVFGRTLPSNVRLLIFISTLMGMGLLGILPFYLWGKYLEQKILE